MTNSTKTFAFPLDDDFLSTLQSELASLRLTQEPRLCVVALIGQGRLSRSHSKGSLISGVIGREALRGIPSLHKNGGGGGGGGGNINIQGHVDLEQRIVYLHLVSIRDAAVLSRVCSAFLSRTGDGASGDGDASADRDSGGGGGGGGGANNDATFHSFMAEAEFEAARALLFLFSVSHLIIVNNPGSRFDLSLVRLFRNLDAIRQKLQPSLTEVLRTVSGVSKEWMYAGRPCSPRMLFVFEKNPLAGGGGGGSGGGGGGSGEGTPAPLTGNQSSAPSGDYTNNSNTNFNNNNNNRSGGLADSPTVTDDHDNLHRRGGASTDSVKRLQHNMEDQIYRILRKARVITNISNNSLFAVPANEEFVYVMHKTDGGDSVESLLDGGRGCAVDDDVLDDPMSFLLKKLSASCVIGGSGGGDSTAASKSSASISSGGSTSNPANWSTGSSSAASNNAVSSSSASSLGPAGQTSTSSQSKSSLPARPTTFKDFVKRHIDQALNKGWLKSLFFIGTSIKRRTTTTTTTT